MSTFLHGTIDGYQFDLSSGMTTNQVLQYNGTKIIAGSVGSSTALWYSLADAANSTNGGGTSVNGSFTVGTKLRVTAACTMTGVRFYWNGANKTIKCSLFASGGSNLATGNVSTTGTGVYTATFGTPYSINLATAYSTVFYVGIWDNSGAVYQNMTITNLSLPWNTAGVSNADNPTLVSPYIQVIGNNFFAAGDVAPTGGGAGTNPEWYPVDPVYTVP